MISRIREVIRRAVYTRTDHTRADIYYHDYNCISCEDHIYGTKAMPCGDCLLDIDRYAVRYNPNPRTVDIYFRASTKRLELTTEAASDLPEAMSRLLRDEPVKYKYDVHKNIALLGVSGLRETFLCGACKSETHNSILWHNGDFTRIDICDDCAEDLADDIRQKNQEHVAMMLGHTL